MKKLFYILSHRSVVVGLSLVAQVVVLDGRIDHVMLLDAVSGQTMGTTIRRDG